MTDLPEALPILRHNANATFGPTSTSDVSSCMAAEGNFARHLPQGYSALLAAEDAKKPTIQHLRWGSSEDAGRVAAGEATAAGCEPPEWRGFDLIVVRRNHPPISPTMFDPFYRLLSSPLARER